MGLLSGVSYFLNKSAIVHYKVSYFHKMSFEKERASLNTLFAASISLT